MTLQASHSGEEHPMKIFSTLESAEEWLGASWGGET